MRPGGAGACMPGWTISSCLWQTNRKGLLPSFPTFAKSELREITRDRDGLYLRVAYTAFHGIEDTHRGYQRALR